MNFNSNTQENPYNRNPVIHVNPPDENEKKVLMMNSLRLDLKINAADFKVIRNLDMIKSATLPKKFPDYFANSMTLSPKKNLDLEAQSPEKKLDKSVNCCLICMDKPPDAVFMDCGHGGELS